jgi:hypothetical protein
MFDELLQRFQEKGIITKVEDQKDVYNRVVNPESDEAEHDKTCLLASLLYPTLDCKFTTI